MPEVDVIAPDASTLKLLAVIVIFLLVKFIEFPAIKFKISLALNSILFAEIPTASADWFILDITSSSPTFFDTSEFIESAVCD